MNLFITKRVDFDWTRVIQLAPSNITTEVKKYPPSRSYLRFPKSAPLFLQYIYNTEFDAALPRKKNIVLAHFEKPYYRDKYGPLMEEVC